MHLIGRGLLSRGLRCGPHLILGDHLRLLRRKRRRSSLRLRLGRLLSFLRRLLLRLRRRVRLRFQIPLRARELVLRRLERVVKLANTLRRKAYTLLQLILRLRKLLLQIECTVLCAFSEILRLLGTCRLRIALGLRLIALLLRSGYLLLRRLDRGFLVGTSGRSGGSLRLGIILRRHGACRRGLLRGPRL